MRTTLRRPSSVKKLIGGLWRALTYCHIEDMAFHIKTTLNIDDTVMARLRREAARRQRTMSELVEAGLRLLFQTGSSGPAPKLPALPKLRSGGHRVDVADRDALLQAMDEG
jgi:hypothetical protein